MTAQRDPDTILAAWLDEGPLDLPDATRRAIVTALPTTTQARRGPFAPWRLPMNPFARVATAAIVAVIAIGGTVYLLGRQQAVGPARSQTPSPSATAAITIPALDATFTSARHGFSIQYPSSWTAALATSPWSAGATLLWGDPALDDVHGSDVRLVAASQPLKDQAAAEWIAAIQADAPSCEGSSKLDARTPVGATAGTVTLNGCAAAGGGITPGGVVYDVLVVSGARGYDFTVDGKVDADYVRALLATVSMNPAAADDRSPAGTYTTTAFKPTLTYTLTNGWIVSESATTLFLDTDAPSGSIGIGGQVVVISTAPECPAEPEAGVGADAASIVAALSANPALEVTIREPLALGPLTAQVIDVSVASSWKRTCPFSGGQIAVPLLVDPSNTDVSWGMTVSERNRLVLVDLGNGKTAMAMLSSNPTFLTVAMPIVNSLRFAP